MTPDARASLFIAILSAHKGLDRAISVADMAVRLNVSERQCRMIKRAVVDSGVCVGSSCAAGRSGFYIPTTADEVKATTANYKARIRSLAELVVATEGAAAFEEFMGQMRLELEEVAK